MHFFESQDEFDAAVRAPWDRYERSLFAEPSFRRAALARGSDLEAVWAAIDAPAEIYEGIALVVDAAEAAAAAAMADDRDIPLLDAIRANYLPMKADEIGQRRLRMLVTYLMADGWPLAARATDPIVRSKRGTLNRADTVAWWLDGVIAAAENRSVEPDDNEDWGGNERRGIWGTWLSVADHAELEDFSPSAPVEAVFQPKGVAYENDWYLQALRLSLYIVADGADTDPLPGCARTKAGFARFVQGIETHVDNELARVERLSLAHPKSNRIGTLAAWCIALFESFDDPGLPLRSIAVGLLSGDVKGRVAKVYVDRLVVERTVLLRFLRFAFATIDKHAAQP